MINNFNFEKEAPKIQIKEAENKKKDSPIKVEPIKEKIE
jgi:hypothetical protein